MRTVVTPCVVALASCVIFAGVSAATPPFGIAEMSRQHIENLTYLLRERLAACPHLEDPEACAAEAWRDYNTALDEYHEFMNRLSHRFWHELLGSMRDRAERWLRFVPSWRGLFGPSWDFFLKIVATNQVAGVPDASRPILGPAGGGS